MPNNIILLHALAPCRSKASASVTAINAKAGTSNVKHTWSVEVAPVCRGDLVYLPKNYSAAGGVRWALVNSVGSTIRLVDPANDLKGLAFGTAVA